MVYNVMSMYLISFSHVHVYYNVGIPTFANEKIFIEIKITPDLLLVTFQ